MTKNQRLLIIGLVALNLICFCIIAPIVFLTMNAPAAPQQVAAQPSAAPLSPTIAATNTPAATQTPLPTNTSVFAPRPTAAPQATATPRSLEAGWKFFGMDSEGYGIALPPNWDRIDFDSNRLTDLLQSLNDKNPQFASQLSAQSQQLVALNIKFFGFDLSNDALSSGLVTNINILRQPLTFSLPLDSYAQVSVQELQKTGSVANLSNKPITIPAGSARVIQYQLTLTTAKGKATSSTTQYLLIHNNYGYILTFTTPPSKEKNYAPIFQKIAQSLQWIP